MVCERDNNPISSANLSVMVGFKKETRNDETPINICTKFTDLKC